MVVSTGYFQEILYRVPLDNWRSYETAVAVDPVPIKAAITGVTYLIGDWLAQANSLQKEDKSWLDADRTRLLRATVVGFVLLGPLAHFYYDFVAELTDWSVPSKILLDQTAYLAFYNTVYYVSLTVRDMALAFASQGLRTSSFSLRCSCLSGRASLSSRVVAVRIVVDRIVA